MAVPTAYATERDLALLTHSVLGTTATALEWLVAVDGPGDYAEPINDVLIAYGATDIADATDIPKVRAIARWMVWRWAADALASRFNTVVGGESLQRKGLYDNAIKQRDYWFAVAGPYMADYAVTTRRIVHLDDPVDAPTRYAADRRW